MEMQELKIASDVVYIAMSGSLDIVGVQDVELEFARLTASDKPVIVDLSEVSFIASLGMRMLLSAAKKLNLAGRKLALVSPPPLVRETLKTAGLDSVMPIYSDLSEARTAVL